MWDDDEYFIELPDDEAERLIRGIKEKLWGVGHVDEQLERMWSLPAKES